MSSGTESWPEPQEALAVIRPIQDESWSFCTRISLSADRISLNVGQNQTQDCTESVSRL